VRTPLWRITLPSSLFEALRTAGVGLKPGHIYSLKDDLITFPETRSGQERGVHFSRPVLLLSNERVCSQSIEPVLLVCPISHQTDLKTACDIYLPKDTENKLSSNSRLILSHIQPVLKTDLGSEIGALSSDHFDKVKAQLIWMFSLDDEDID
jgi:mRNA-degrading endonuclease toxin of MazEF toxin-antitoxin module